MLYCTELILNVFRAEASLVNMCSNSHYQFMPSLFHFSQTKWPATSFYITSKQGRRDGISEREHN